jgi:hypothetical protein
VGFVWEENFEASNKRFSRVHFQLRHNMTLSGDFLTPENINAYLPVILKGNERFIVAFLMESADGMGVYVSSI